MALRREIPRSVSRYPGGGFRATLFHLGVVAALRELGLLPQVKAISSVSGGSVLGAHMVQNWEKYTGTQEEFAEVADRVIRLTTVDVRGHILRRLAPTTALRVPLDLLAYAVPGENAKTLLARASRRLRATGMLARQYRQLYQEGLLRDLRGGGRPQILMLATNFNTLELCAFSGEGFSWGPDWNAPVARGQLRIAMAVSASSAFPASFPRSYFLGATWDWTRSCRLKSST